MTSLATLRADRVQEITNTTGTGTLTLAGAVASFQAFSSAFATGDTVEYTILSGTSWEVGIGTYTTSGTTLSRDVILRSSNSNSAITVAAGALVWSNVGADTITSSVQPFRNRALNGAMRFDQYNEGAAYTISGSTATIDAWSGVSSGAGTFTMQRVADPDDARLFALKISCTVADASIAAGDVYNIYTAIEGYDVADLHMGAAGADTVTISFDMRMSVVGTYGIGIHNEAVNRSYVALVTQNVANVTEHKTVTLTLDTSGTWVTTTGAGLYVRFVLAAGSDYYGTANAWQASNLFTTAAQANFMSANTNVGYLKNFQFEKGKVATPFERIDYQKDLARLQRYACKSHGAGNAVTATPSVGWCYAPYVASVTVFLCSGGSNFPVPMRTIPTMTGWTPSTGTINKWSDTVAGEQTVTFNNVSTGGFGYVGLAAGSTFAYGHWYANSRLS